MSTVLNTNGAELTIPAPLNDNFQFTVVTAEWNPEITHALRDGALDVLQKAGVADKNITTISVPGTVELVNIAAKINDIQHRRNLGAIIVIGCVIRGDTPHFDYVCLQASQGVAAINAKGQLPVIFGVLTVENQQQAFDRAGGKLGNKGAEAACAAIEMANIHHRLESLQP